MVLIEEDCSLCSVTYPYYSLYRCYICGRLFCRNCFLYDVDGMITCLRCARRRISPKGHQSKYALLSTYLARRAKYSNQVTLPFSRIEEIIGERLPFSAHHYEHWWSNTRNRSPSEAWLTVGWNTHIVDLGRKEVIFRKDEQVVNKPFDKKGKRKRVSATFKAMALKHKPRKPSGPSKTKIAKVQARSKNIERKQTFIKEYEGKFKPRKAYEKRLYKPDEKPD